MTYDIVHWHWTPIITALVLGLVAGVAFGHWI